MAFRTTATLDIAFRDAITQAAWVKGIMQSGVQMLQSNTNATQIFQLIDNVRGAIQLLNADAAVPGIGAYAQAQYNNDVTYNVATEFNAMVNALNAVITWVFNNFPKDTGGFVQAYTLQTDGSRTPAVFTPAQTAGLTSALNAAIATIS